MASSLFSDPGVALATFLHTFGAIGYMGGIAFYVGWARSVQRGHDNPTVLATGASLTYVSIMGNLFGGFLRTYQPGHPGLSQFGASTWVTVMAIKHLALFAGIAAAVYLFELHAPRLRRAARDGVAVAKDKARNARAMLTTVVASIVVAAVLGGASVVIDIDGVAQPAGGAGVTIPERIDAGGPYRYEGTVSSNAADSGTFVVPFGTSRLDATFGAPAPGGLPLSPYQFTIELRDPTGAGTQRTTQAQPTDPRSAAVEMASPTPGAWTYVVTTDAAAAAEYGLDIVLTGGTVFEETVMLAAGDSLEINTRAEAGAALHWDWQATGHVEWDIHTHFSGFEAVAEGHSDADAGTYTTEQAGGHSFSWQADEAVTLVLLVWGDFDIESVVA